MKEGFGRVPAEDAVGPLVLALDVGSTASRGDVFDATGRPVEGGRVKKPHAFTTAADGTSQIDPDQVVAELRDIISELAGRRRHAEIGGVALDTFASSLVGVAEDGSALTPCYTYADSRCSAQATQIRRELDEAEVQQRTGCRIHTSYLAPRLRWLKETDAATFGRVRWWMSLGEYAYLSLIGATAAGTSTAAWTGMLDRRTGAWDAELLAAAGIAADHLSEVRDPDRPLTTAGGATGAWPALAEARWFPPITDGFASNLGAGADDEDSAAVAAATSGAIRVLVHQVPERIPSGLWCYRVDARRSLLGGAVNDVGRVVSWLESTVQLGGADPDQVLAAEPDPATPLVLPYLSGERATGWVADARATFAGVSAATTGAQLFRGAMEGVAISYARIADQLRTVARPGRILASGRVTQDVPAWQQILADVLEAPVEPVTIKRTTLHGTALHALEVLAPDTERTPPSTGPTFTPSHERADYYRGRAAAYDSLYAAVTAHGSST
ncbi:gluconokinase [Motilibacter rhizosphaerae]|uniref:Gluconokinase n=1 Tax=Motilibacter rhizosphaerae TaxID=598652 RepID=A0A4Q7NAN9_9ACTN|nr:gluconokinase [Motilibacter rhizosphaerae]RZS79956.1 gluconokinase [Motilibacter rhizosphaerae]